MLPPERQSAIIAGDKEEPPVVFDVPIANSQVQADERGRNMQKSGNEDRNVTYSPDGRTQYIQEVIQGYGFETQQFNTEIDDPKGKLNIL